MTDKRALKSFMRLTEPAFCCIYVMRYEEMTSISKKV